MNGSPSIQYRAIQRTTRCAAVATAPRAASDEAGRYNRTTLALAPAPASAACRLPPGARSATCLTMTTTPPLHPPLSVTPKQHKSRRKISLPWFRQNSVSAPHSALSRQHTIDTPSSFQARLLKGSRQRQVNASYPIPVAGFLVLSGYTRLNYNIF